MKQSVLTLCLVSALAIPVKAEITFDPDCVLYYDFETLSPDGKIVNLAKPGTMDLAGGGSWAEASYPVEATPAAKLRQERLAVTSEDSAKSLRTTWLSGNEVAYRYFQPTENWFSTTNFTVEFFYKMDGSIPAWTPLFRRTGANNVQINIGVGGTASMLRATVMTGEDSGSYATVSINDDAATGDGKWHHAALVVSQTSETKTIRFYRDYKLKGAQTLANNLSAHTPGTYVTLAGSSGVNCFNGWMESVRMTLRALEPEEFLWGEGMEIGRFPASATIAHVTFNDASPNASLDCGTLGNGTYRDIVPTYSGDVPGPHIRDGVDGELLTKRNAKSISFPDTTDHSWVSYGSINNNPSDTYYLHTSLNGQYRTSGTIEFWMKSNQADADYDTVLLNYYARNKSGTAYQPIVISFSTDHRLVFGFSASGVWRGIIAANTDVLDGKWHHVAFTFKPAPTDPAKMVATCYVDYAQAATLTCDGQLLLENNGYFDLRFAGQHGSSSNGKNYGGLIDELRISDCALESSQFLRAENAPGLSIVVR